MFCTFLIYHVRTNKSMRKIEKNLFYIIFYFTENFWRQIFVFAKIKIK